MPGRLTRLTHLDTTRTAVPPQPRLRPRGLPPALEPYGVYTATSPADAALLGTDLLGSHRVRVAPADTRGFIATYHAVLLRDITLGYLDYRTDVQVNIRETTRDQLIIVPASGASTITIQDQPFETSPLLAATPKPGEPLIIDCDRNTAHLVVRIERAALCRHLSRLVGRPVTEPPRFDPTFDLSSPSASRWNSAIQMLHTELLEPGSLINHGRGIGPLEEFIMSSLVYSHPSDITPELSPTRRCERDTVRIAKEFMLTRLSDPVSIAEIADAAEVTVRTLQQHFRTDVGESPTTYLKHLRLDRAREDLADAAAGTTVADVASRWGLTHLGRFSASYRERFGELPSQTLRS